MKFGYIPYGCSMSDVRRIEEMLGATSLEVACGEELDGLNLFILFGGEDISPSLYGEGNRYSGADDIPSERDDEEKYFFEAAVDRGIPVLGICRGAQLSCALLGGKLWQHVDNHAVGQRGHVLRFNRALVDEFDPEREYRTNSYHHQMMRPSEEMEVLAYSPCLSPVKFNADGRNIHEEVEPEIVYHRGKKVLMIQGHPEWTKPNDDLSTITSKLVKDLLCN